MANQEKYPSRAQVMAGWSVHKLTKQVLELAAGRDCVDVVNDVEMALAVLKGELVSILGVPVG